MQTTEIGFTAEASDAVRNIAHSLLVSWHKEYNLTGSTFTVGVSTIEGADVIGANPGALGSPGSYNYFDESDYALSLGWERGLNMPIGGISKALAEALLENTTGRFTPRYLGGSSELFTAILPRRPVIINAGFNYSGVDQMIPQFVGVITEQPQISMRERQVKLKMEDYINFFENRYFDRTSMFTGQRSDILIETFLTQLGVTTSQFVLDQGLQTIDFLIAENGAKFSNVISDIAAAENGYFYQDESGIFRFENREHWSIAPFTSPAQSVFTAQVIDNYTTNINDTHLINVVEIKANPRRKRAAAVIYTQSGSIELGTGSNEIFLQFDNPVLAASAPSYTANSEPDGSGSDVTGSVSITSTSLFAQAAKYIFDNASGSTAYITSLTVTGREAAPIYAEGIYIRKQDDSSVTAYEERPVSIENDYIQSQAWADNFADSLLSRFAEPENLQTIVIRAKPHLQLGDLISWQGGYWRIYDIKTSLDPSYGFVQELAMLQRSGGSSEDTFTVGISSIGGTDVIAV